MTWHLVPAAADHLAANPPLQVIPESHYLSKVVSRLRESALSVSGHCCRMMKDALNFYESLEILDPSDSPRGVLP